MVDGKSNKDKEVTPKGAVEVDDTELDQAAGGADQPQASAFVVTFDRPIDPASKDPASGATIAEKKI